MGYTHYFYRKAELDNQNFSRYAELVGKLVDTPEAKEILAEEYDETSTPAIVTLDLIQFNGKDDEGHETFYFPRVMKHYEYSENGLVFEFCKTARKPYDKYVVASLIFAKVIFGKDVRFSSDGELSDMEEGKALAESVLGKKISLKETKGDFSVKVSEKKGKKLAKKTKTRKELEELQNKLNEERQKLEVERLMLEEEKEKLEEQKKKMRQALIDGAEIQLT